jgi:hypothetical protein
VRTLVVSDLHFGTIAGVDLLRRAAVRETLIERLDRDIDRLVVLGDCLEFRETPVAHAVEHAIPFLREVGQVVDEIILAGGNHDHQLVGGWTEQFTEPLGLEHRIPPADAGPIPHRLADAAKPARLELTYPGIWLREDVYGHHGHYLDLHTTVPTIERLAAGSMSRLISPIPQHGAVPADYEAALAPLYAWMFALAQWSKDSVARAGSKSSSRAWSALAGPGRRKQPVRALALTAALRTGTAAFNRAGVGPLNPRLSGAVLRQGSLYGIGDAMRRLGVDAPYVLFGHTHRSGPWPVDDPAEWITPTGSQLMNTGSWVYQRHFLGNGSGDGPYWPGTAIVVDESGPPRLERLLADRTHDQLRPDPA